MGAEVQQHVRAEVLSHPAIEGVEGVGRRVGALEQQAHRVALVAHARLDPDHDPAQPGSHDEQRAAVRQVLSGGRSPGALELGEVLRPADVVVGRDPRHHVGVGAVLSGVALEHALGERLGGGRNLDVVAVGRHRLQRAVQRAPHREVGRGSGGAAVGREVEQHDADVAVSGGHAAQRDEPLETAGDPLDPLVDAHHRVAVRGAAPAEHARRNGTVELGDRDHHRGLDRGQAGGRGLPVLDALELEGLRGDERNVEALEHLRGSTGVVERRAAHEREPGQRQHGVDDDALGVEEELLDRGPVVQTRGVGDDHSKAAALERLDDAVVVPRVAGEDVRAHDEHADRADRIGSGGQGVDRLRDPRRNLRVIEPHLGVDPRRRGIEGAPQAAARAVGVLIDEQADEVGDVVGRARQQIRHRQKVGAHVLGLARDVLEQLGHQPQHRELSGAALLAGLALGLAAQLLEQRHALLRSAHAECAHAGQLHDLPGGHRADDRVALRGAGLQRRKHRAHVLVEEEHVGEDDVALGDVATTALHRRRIAKARQRVKAQVQSGDLRRQSLPHPPDHPRDVMVEGDEHDDNARCVRLGSGPWHHRASPG